MTKAEIAKAMQTRLGGFSKKEASELVDLLFETMKETLGRGEAITISNFGRFGLRDKSARRGRDPQTGAPLTIPARRVLAFRAGERLRKLLNRPSEVADAAEE